MGKLIHFPAGYFTAIVLLIIMTACGPTVSDYSDALEGRWERPVEVQEDGFIERGTLYLTFSPIAEGNVKSSVSVLYEATLDGSLEQAFSADCRISLEGVYAIDADSDDYPLDLQWNINTLDVKIDKVRIENVVADFSADLEDITGSVMNLGGGSRKYLTTALKKMVNSYCRTEIMDRNDDPGWYGVRVDEDRLTIMTDDDGISFTRSN